MEPQRVLIGKKRGWSECVIEGTLHALLTPLVLMLCWNWLAPEWWSGAPHVGYWQVVIANICLKFLIGGTRFVRTLE